MEWRNQYGEPPLSPKLLRIDLGLQRFAVAGAGSLVRCQQCVQPFEGGGIQLQLFCRQVFAHVRDEAAAGDGNHVAALGLEPGEGELASSHALVVGDGLELFQFAQVVRQVQGAEARHAAAHVIFCKLGGIRYGAGQECRDPVG